MLRAAFSFLCAVALLPNGIASAETPAETAVLAPVHKLLDGIGHGDKAAMLAAISPDSTASRMRGGKLLQGSMSELFAHAPAPKSGQKLEERIHDPIVHIDDDIAVVWAPYTFFVDGKVHHCGTDVMTLAKVNGKWLISGLADNARNSCPHS